MIIEVVLQNYEFVIEAYTKYSWEDENVWKCFKDTRAISLKLLACQN